MGKQCPNVISGKSRALKVAEKKQPWGTTPLVR